MRALNHQAGRRGLWCALLLSGCVRLQPVPESVVLTPDPAADRKAAALARSSQALVDEREGRAEAAISNLAAAVELDPDNEELRYRAALALMQQKRTPEAQDILRKGVERNPASEKAMLWLALSHRAADENDRAIAVYRRAIRAAPESPIAYLESAALLARDGQLAEALDVIDQGLDRVKKPSDLLVALTDLLVKRAGSAPPDDALRRQIARAIDMVRAERAKAPDEKLLILLNSDLHVLAGQHAEAIELLEALARANPDDETASQKLAALLAGIGDKDRALGILQSLIARNPSQARLHFHQGELLEQAGDVEAARAAFTRAAEAGRPDPAAYLKLAVMLVDDDPPAAIEWLRKGIARIPRDPRIAEMLGYLLLSEDRPVEAVPVFEEAAKLRSRLGEQTMPPALRLSHVLALQMSGRIPDAGRILRESVAEQPAMLPGYVQLVLRSGDTNGALAAVSVVDIVREADPRDPAPLIYQGLLYSAAERFTNALARFAEAEQGAAAGESEEEALDAQFHFWFASAAERSGDIDQAALRFQRCLELEPDFAEAMNYLAYMWAEKGRSLPEALRWSKRSLELEPDNPAYLDTLGWIYFMQGDVERALREIQRAANLMPEDPTIVEHLGDVMDKLGKKDRAIGYWKRSFVLDPDVERVRDRLTAAGVDLAPLVQEAEARRAPAARSEKLRRLGDEVPAATPETE